MCADLHFTCYQHYETVEIVECVQIKELYGRGQVHDHCKILTYGKIPHVLLF